MLKCASVYTCEVDDADVALAEINSQLQEKIVLLDNTVGIIMCHIEFIASGVLKHVCGSLPFDIAGVTTASQAVNGAADDMILTIFVMTSDDVYFRAGFTGSMETDIYGPVKASYEKAATQDIPKLALAFPPFLDQHAGDSFVEAWERLIPGVPVFGTLPTDDTYSLSESHTIYNGEVTRDCMAYVLCYGNIHPRFVIGIFSEDNSMPYKGEITKSNGIYVAEINNRNAYQYFEELGLAKDGVPHNIFNFVPFLIDQINREDYDGVPILRELGRFTEDGTAVFRGNMDQGSTFKLLQGTYDDVLKTLDEKMAEATALSQSNGILSFSCIVRRMIVMQTDSLIELKKARDIIGATPFMMGYAGGEFCPTSVKDGIATNRFHAYTIVTLII
jgi:hypothetical protein